MVRYQFAAFLLHGFDRVVQEEIYQDGVNAGHGELVDTILFWSLLRGKLLFVYFFGITVVGMGGVFGCSEVLGFHFGVLPFDFSFDELDAPDAGSAEFDLPVGSAWDWFEITDVAL